MKTPGDLVAAYHSQLRTKLQPARDAAGGGPYTFVFVRRTPSPKPPGEFAFYRFICFSEAPDALLFYSRWRAVQDAAAGQDATSLMEAGPSDPSTPRKWVIDLDAKLSDLQAFGLVAEGAGCTEADLQRLHALVLRYAAALSCALRDGGYTERACHCAVKTRHRPAEDGTYAKLSWHVTLCVFAPYAELREAVAAAEALACPQPVLDARTNRRPLPKAYRGCDWTAAVLADQAITNNSKGQFIQALGSEKVAACEAAGGHRFVFCGVFRKGAAVPCEPEHEFPATSMSMPDPFSILLRVPGMMDEQPPIAAKKKRPRSNDEGKSAPPRRPLEGRPYLMQLARWELLPEPWMITFLRADKSKLSVIPSMNTGSYIPEGARQGEILFYAKVEGARMCPRHLAANNRAYRHGKNGSVMAVCVRPPNIPSALDLDDDRPRVPPAPLLFTFCFSVKCRTLTPGGWVRVDRDMLRRVL